MTDRLVAYIRKEETERIIGIIEYYITTLGDSTAEKNTKHILEHVIRTIEHNV
jgi:hypothetical protein